MCTSLNDLFSCLRPQVTIESDGAASPYQASEDMGARRTALKLKQLKKEPRSKAGPPGPGSATVRVLSPARPPKLSPPSGCVRPSSRDSRVSYEAMERYDQIFGGPAGPEQGATSSSRNIPDQF